MASSKNDEEAPGLDLALSKLGLAPRPGTKDDNFYTPHNEDFYSNYKYWFLERNRRQIRLLKVFHEEKTLAKHLDDYPRWVTSVSDPAPVGFPSRKPFPPPKEPKLLACEIIDGVPLSACTGQYLALSYAAGDPADTASILVDGHIFNAFAQLVHALKCAVSYSKKKNNNQDGYFLLWVDQICINQSDPEERSHQVMMMRDIYSNCATTLVCLSITDEESVVADNWGFHQKHNGLEWLTIMKGSNLVEVFWNNCFQDRPVAGWLASFLAFLRCPWWARSWVYQEFVCSPEVHLLYGDESASWEEIAACLTPHLGSWCDLWTSRLASKSHLGPVRAKQQEYNEKLAQERAQEHNEKLGRTWRMPRSFAMEVEERVGDLVKQLTSPDVQQSMRPVAAMLDGWSKHGSQVGDLRDLLRHARNLQASDTRDKIYAFVGLAREDYAFEPSYSPENTAVHVFVDAARRILDYDGDLTYLLEQAFAGRKDLGFFLPSWVPDWNCCEDKRVLLELQHKGELDSSSDSPRALDSVDSSSDKNLNIESRENDSERFSLRVTGRRIATLTQKWKTISPNLRQFETDSGVAIYAPTTARPKNEIWSLSGCKWLVFLRREAEDKYYFGGFAVVRELEDKITPKEAVDEVLLI